MASSSGEHIGTNDGGDFLCAICTYLTYAPEPLLRSSSLEICLDHSNLIQQAKISHKRTAYYPCTAQISIVTSGGMWVQVKSLVIASRGSIFLQDGINPDAPQVVTATAKINKRRKSRTYVFNKSSRFINSFFPFSRTRQFKRHYVYRTRNAASRAVKGLYPLYKNIPPRVNVYAPVPIVRSDRYGRGGICRWQRKKPKKRNRRRRNPRNGRHRRVEGID